MVTNGMIIGEINGFDESLIEELGWSRGALAVLIFLTFCAGMLIRPVQGASEKATQN